MKMNATKLTIALVALLLALTCVFAACGKKNNTDKPDDTTPVDNTPVAVDTVAKEDLNAIAENLKTAYAANYVDLYAPATATDIEAAKSAALINIFAATSKEEAQKVADDFIAYLKAQKTIIDSIAALVEKVGDVSLKDAEAINELKDITNTLATAYAGSNAAKKAALDAYNADAATQKTVKALISRYNVLVNAKNVADTAKGEYYANGVTKAVADGINVKIAAMKADFAKADKEFALDDFNDYEEILDAIKADAKAYDIAEGTDAYNEVYDFETLKAAKAVLDAAFAKDEVLVKLQAVVNESKALEAAVKEAQWREYVWIDAEELKETATGAFTTPVTLADGTVMYAEQAVVLSKTTGAATVTLPDGATKKYDDTSFKLYATEEDALKVTTIKAAVKVEAVIPVAEIDYKLTLNTALESAVKAREALKDYTAAQLKKNGYDVTDLSGTKPVNIAVDYIDAMVVAYKASVTRASTDYQTLFTGASALIKKTDLDILGTDAKGATYGTYKLDAELNLMNKKIGNTVSTNQANIATAITNATSNFTAQSETGTFKDGSGLYQSAAGAYIAATGKTFDLVNGVPAITYTAWTYRYQVEKAGDLAGTTQLDAFALVSAGGAATAKAALRWLAMYIGDGEYAASYNFADYADYDDVNNFFSKTVTLVMTDTAITEVAVPGVVKIRDNDVNVAKDETAVEAKLLSAYTVAKALVAEQEKIDAAKAEAVEQLKADALALREAGEADAVDTIASFRANLANGKYLNKKLYGKNVANAYLAVNITAANDTTTFVAPAAATVYPYVVGGVKVVIDKDETKELVDLIITRAVAAKTKAETALNKIEAEHVEAGFVTLKDLDDIYYAGKTQTIQVTPANTADVTTNIYAINQSLAANKKYAEIFEGYIAKAKAIYDIAAAGEAAKVIDTDAGAGLDAKGNLTKDQAEDNLKQVRNISYIFDDFGNFDLGNTAINGTGSNFGTFLGTYQPASVDGTVHTALIARIGTIFNAKATAGTDKYSKEDNRVLALLLEVATKDFAEKFGAYKGMTKVIATDTLANDGVNKYVDLADKAIDDFAVDAKADYINLKVTYAFGDDVVEYDLLTETYKALTMKKAYSVITKVLDYAKTFDYELTTDVNGNHEFDAGDGDVHADGTDANTTIEDTAKDLLILAGWDDAATKRVNKQAVDFKAVTSITAANNALKTNAVPEATYDFEGALAAIKETVSGASKALRDVQKAAYAD